MPGKVPSHYSANSTGISLVKPYRRGRTQPCLAAWCTVGARFFRALQSPATVGKVVFMKIIIAGGTGFLGGPLAEMYAEDGHDVRVLTRSLAVRRHAARSRHRRPGHHARRVEGRWQQRAVGGGARRRGRRHQSFRRVAGGEALVCRDKDTNQGEPHPGDAQARGGDPGGEGSACGLRQRQRRRLLRAVRQANRSPRAIRPAPISWRSCARTGNRKRARPNVRERVSCCSGRASSSNDREGRCRR